MKLINQVKKVKHETDIGEVNKMLEQDWILLEIFHSPAGITFSLGKI